MHEALKDRRERELAKVRRTAGVRRSLSWVCWQAIEDWSDHEDEEEEEHEEAEYDEVWRL